MKRLLALLLLAVAVACSARDGGEVVGSTSSGLELPTGAPIPNNWDGSAVELLVADAWAGCSGDTSSGDIAQPGDLDTYLAHVLAKMQQSMLLCPVVSSNPLERWLLARKLPACNKLKGENASITITPQQFFGTLGFPVDVNADPILRFPSQNLCVAQKLRAASPGAAGIDTLTLPPPEQREILEVARERAQLAALGYAKVLEIYAAPVPVTTSTAMERVRVALDDGRVQAEVRDGLRASVQALTISTEETLELFARSASARVPHSATTTSSVPTEAWGPGSWRQRALAALYGGDPLGPASDGSAPWPTITASVLAPPPAFVGVDVHDALVLETLEYAKRYDAVALRMKPLEEGNSCHPVDEPISALRLYKTIEAGLRTDRCVVFVSNACQPVSPSSIPDPNLGTADFLLWTEHRIGFDIARTLVSQLASFIGRRCENIGGGGGPYEVPGAMNVEGVEDMLTVANQGSEDGEYYHVQPGAKFTPHDRIEEHMGRQGSRGAFTTLSGVTLGQDNDVQEFPANNAVLELRRTAGSVASLIGIRHDLDTALTSAQPEMLTKLRSVLDAIGAAAGTRSISLEPKLEDQGSGLVLSDRLFTLYATPDDPFFVPASVSEYALLVIDDPKLQTPNSDDLLPALIQDPSYRSFSGETLASRLVNATILSAQPTSTWDDLATPLVRWTFNGGSFFNLDNAYLVARRGTGPSAKYLLLAGPVDSSGFLAPPLSRISFHGGTGGTLNDRALQMLKVQTENPAQPFYDAFGYPLKLYPPTDPYLTGNTSGTASTKVYLDNANKAAEAAVTAVTVAYQSLLEKEKASLDVTAQVARSTQVIDASRRLLCGDKKPDCGKTLELKTIGLIGGANITRVADITNECNGGAGHYKELACMVRDLLAKYNVTVKLAEPVKAALNGADASFADYEGGTLQGIFIEQLADFRRIEDQIAQYDTAYQVAKARIAASDAALNGVSGRVDQNCSVEAFVKATAAGVSAGFASVTVSAGPVMAQWAKCDDLKTEVAPAQAQALLSFVQGIDEMQQTYMRLADAGKLLGLAVASGTAAIQSSKLGEERGQLDKDLAESQDPTKTITYRQFHDYDVWRARALVENARRYAILARRAIEARYVVDLSTMQAPEPFVASPAGWADQIYEYDMNMPSAVGLTLGGQQATGSMYPNVVVDYVGNLQRFVDGFAVKRPTAANLADTEVVSLPGPSGIGSGAQLPPGVIDSEAYRWTFFCPAQQAWASIPSNGAIDEVCGSTEKPTLARLRFDLDPWGRVRGLIASEAYQKRFNSRWTKLALNVVGTGILDCTKAKDPLTCYSQSFLRYDLSHVGPAWTTNYEQAWWALEVPKGQIEGAKALAAEQWFDPLSNAWSKPYISQIARTEFLDRPLGGAYQVVFQLGPEVVLSHVERVQLLFDAAYWVKQQ